MSEEDQLNRNVDVLEARVDRAMERQRETEVELIRCKSEVRQAMLDAQEARFVLRAFRAGISRNDDAH